MVGRGEGNHLDAINHTNAIATLHCCPVLVCVLKYTLTPSRPNNLPSPTGQPERQEEAG